MALKATIFKASVQVSDTDRHYYASHALTLARHPSETDERMMVRLLALVLNGSRAEKEYQSLISGVRERLTSAEPGRRARNLADLEQKHESVQQWFWESMDILQRVGPGACTQTPSEAIAEAAR